MFKILDGTLSLVANAHMLPHLEEMFKLTIKAVFENLN